VLPLSKTEFFNCTTGEQLKKERNLNYLLLAVLGTSNFRLHPTSFKLAKYEKDATFS